MITSEMEAPAHRPAAEAGRRSASASVVPPNYLLQLGVFANQHNAEELYNRLRTAGIPAQLETRVQVGPFASREEAAKAQEKLNALGVGRGMLVQQNRKP
ncbi:MAG: hypothetical protein CGU28_14130 [Candidatus Dactylopiibacterium carminicum]|uniref:SPOR domain-containing protein n=1 Tax=Candidatus Dactylopiibacterium carminicum TaxID=857335 RepID=A0A272EYL1_9RHOO|nr:SPOR domain-containing protein [Candidatus Dactylopiibacterium carminicum]KAF7600560.1 SPOR domain-containing protein [Candidatus Dactylopiibacterium carminicum]PAS94203.1 MAG: hypothetical protein CGU28_14130 [Candidatus Dactylopiibacterium carminicum]PAS95203.1 MAG: hypothetical protein CGU29_01825 [Candidatus Dactylopiibacterium carminicum]PAT00564.1 MAG: hypothetical protein BSR46_01360 [Candidatus Dactylopiibacterium carminicum]